jgi:hypothetical protein
MRIQLRYVSVHGQDLKALRRFYEHDLGLKVSHEAPDGTVEVRAAPGLDLCLEGPSESAALLVFRVNDIQAARKDLLRGGHTVDGPHPGRHPFATVRDPAGNLVAFEEDPSLG